MELDGIVWFEKDIADSILARFGKFAANVDFSLSLEKVMGDGGHDTCAVTVTTVRSSCSTVSH